MSDKGGAQLLRVITKSNHIGLVGVVLDQNAEHLLAVTAILVELHVNELCADGPKKASSTMVKCVAGRYIRELLPVRGLKPLSTYFKQSTNA